MKNEALLFLLSFLPTVETRYTIPLMVATGVSPPYILIMATIVNAILSTSLAYLLWVVDGILRKIPGLQTIWIKYVDRTRLRVSKYIKRYGALGLAMFVAIPLPGTGIWTGSTAGYFLGMDRNTLALSTFVGGMISSIIALLLSVGLLTLL